VRTPALSLPANYSVEVDARQVSSNSVSLGLVFDMLPSDPYLFYLFRIEPDYGDYRLDKLVCDSPSGCSLDPLIDWTVHAAINPLNQPNHLRVDRVGSGIWLHINGVYVNTYDDGALAGPGRDAGLFAGPYPSYAVPAEARFDNFRVTSPQ
jgi:hypothetical protein